MARVPSSSGTLAPTVMVMDHDESSREDLRQLLGSVGLRAELFASPADLLGFVKPPGPSCLIMEFRLPTTNGLNVQTRMRSINAETPIIFISGHGDIPTAVRAMKAGAVDFLSKPLRQQDLLDAVHAALELDARRQTAVHAQAELERRFEMLTSREREVMWHVTSGLMNKQVAGRMGLSEITVKVHRGNAMRKMKSKSLAEFVRQAQTLFGEHDVVGRPPAPRGGAGGEPFNLRSSRRMSVGLGHLTSPA